MSTSSQLGSGGAMNRISLVVSILALIVAGLSAWGTFAQVQVAQTAISESLSIEAEYMQVGEADSDKRLTGIDDPAPTIESGEHAYIFVDITNLGRADGVLTSISLPLPGYLDIAVRSIECATAPDEKYEPYCQIPHAIPQGQTLFMKLDLGDEEIYPLTCPTRTETFSIRTRDSVGKETLFNTRLAVPIAEYLTCQ